MTIHEMLKVSFVHVQYTRVFVQSFDLRLETMLTHALATYYIIARGLQAS